MQPTHILIWILVLAISRNLANTSRERRAESDELAQDVQTNTENMTNTESDLVSRHHEGDEWTRAEEDTDCGFKCVEDDLCISAHKVCNNFVDCMDSSDEQGCTCKERVGLKKQCDGFTDCPDDEDEIGCGCADDEFACKVFERDAERISCIPNTKRCDGHIDCTLGEDEENCFRLSPLSEDDDGIASAGFLEKRIGNEWYLVCKGVKSDSMLNRFVDKACSSIVGETTETAHYARKIFTSKMIKRFKDHKFALLGESDSKFVPITGQCPSKSVTAVQCPAPECGWPAGSAPPSTRAKRHSGAFDLDKLGELTAKIVGGQDSTPGSWPSIVGIYRNGTFHCGGSIIDTQWILTAAHCFHNYEKYVFEVQAGMLRRFSWSPTEQSRQVTNIYVHERYDSKIFLNDIALMKLDRELELSKWVSTACLVRSDQAHLDPHAGQSCTVTGWGDIAESIRGPDQMQEVALPVIPKCVETFTKDTMQICAGFKEGGRDACQGDSGGPFSCSDDKGRHIVAGIVSFGRGCARPNQPGVYTRVSHYTAWIDSVVSGANQIVKTQAAPLKCEHELCRRSGGQCVFPKMLCDRKVDCLDGSDEMDCDFSNIENFHTDFQVDERAYTEVEIANHAAVEHTHAFGRAKLCGPSEFQCSITKSCVPENVRCNGKHDCSDSTDEKFCQCGMIIANRFPKLKCDGFKHCSDGSDEFASECTFCNGKSDQMKCPLSNQCILHRNWCDGTKHCPDGEDEVDCIRLVKSNAINQAPDFLGDKITRGLQSGIVVLREKGMEWSQACEEDTDESFADLTCSYLGFNTPSLTRKRREGRVYIPRPLPKAQPPFGRSLDPVPLSEIESNKVCTPVKVNCGELKCGIEKLYTHSRRNPLAIEFGAQPWFTVITVDGKPKCGATLVHERWLLASSTCISDNIQSLTSQYVAGVFSFTNQSVTISSPIEQIKRINSIDTVPGGLSYLHLESSMRSDHFANPICTKLGLHSDPEEFHRADCRIVWFDGSQIADTRIEIDSDHSVENEHLAIRMNDKLCNDLEPSFVYCTFDGSEWFFTGSMDTIDHDQCGKAKFVQLFNPFYGESSEKTLTTLQSPPNQNVFPPKCEGVRCSLGNCVEKSQICDNIAQCADNEDEKRCSRHFLGIKASGSDDELDDSHSPNTTLSRIQCPIGHFQCKSTANCIPISTWCDGAFDCGTDDLTDEPDESECTCRHYLALAAPERVCDNIIHCPNREDEMEGCPCDEFSFYCDTGSKSGKCMSQIFVCDGHEDCENGEDEKQCLALSLNLDELTPSKDENGIDGFVVVKVKGTWHPYCSNLWSQELGNQICSNLLPNTILDDMQTFDVNRFDDYDTIVLVTNDFNGESEHRVVKIEDDDFEGEERFGDASTCEIGYVKCVESEEK